jgi:streptogramin lyase
VRARVLVAAALCAAAALPSAAGAAATPEFFTVPDNCNVAAGIVADPTGNVWFSGASNGAVPPPIGRLVPGEAVAGTSNGFSLFPTPAVAGESCCANQLRGLAYETDAGRLWFIRSTGVYGYGTVSALSPNTTNGMTAVRLPSGMDLGGIALKGEEAWITEISASNTTGWPGNRIFSTNSSLGAGELPALSEYSGTHQSIRYDAKPAGVTVAPDGSVWFTESDTGNPGYRIAKVGGGTSAYEEHPVVPCDGTSPCSGSFSGTGPLGIAATSDGVIWFTNVIANAVQSFDPQTGVMKRYRLTDLDPTLSAGQPRTIRVAPDGTLWVAEFGFISHPSANAIIRIVPATTPQANPTADIYKTGAGKAPLGAAPDAKGNVWFLATGDTQPDYIGRLAGVIGTAPPVSDPGTGTTQPPVIAPPAPGGTTLTPSGIGISRVEDPHVNNDSVTVRQICVGPPADRCSLVYLLDAHEYVQGFPGTRASTAAKKRKTRRVVVGRKTVTLRGGQKKTVVIKLNAKGRKILKRDGKLNATLHVNRKVAGGKTKKLKAKKVVFKRKR